MILPAFCPNWASVQIGLVASATLLGTATVTLAIGFLAACKDLSF
jgi:hypothetical protein